MYSSPCNEIRVDAANPIYNSHGFQRMVATVPAHVENSTIVEIFAQQSLTLKGTDSRRVTCAGNLSLQQCTKLGWISAKGEITLDRCKNLKIVISDTALKIFHSIINDYAFSNGGVNIVNSEIEGQLICTSNELIIIGSKINFLYMRLENLIRDHFQQKIILRNSTLNSVQFGGRAGVIILEGSSNVKGPIVGGRIF